MSKLITADQARGVVRGVPFEWEGRLRGRGPGTPNVWTGNGPPSTSTLPGYGATGDFYWDKKVGDIWWCESGGLPGTWLRVAFSQTSPPGFLALRPTTQAVAATTWTKVLWSSVATPGWNPDGGFSTANSRYTAPRAGLYDLAFFVTMSIAEAGRCLAAFYVNGTEARRVADYTAQMGVGGAGAVYLNATDYVEAWVSLAVGANIGGDSGVLNWFTGRMVG